MQADLGLGCLHTLEDIFSHRTAHIFSYISMKTYVQVLIRSAPVCEMLLMSTYKIIISTKNIYCGYTIEAHVFVKKSEYIYWISLLSG